MSLKTKTSEQWFKDEEFKHIQIIDADGWNRDNFEYSWFVEEITKIQFIGRILRSTIKHVKKSNTKLNDLQAELALDRKLEVGEHPDGCKGVYYRCRIGSFVGMYDRYEINTRIRFRKLKKLSCPGCAVCEYEEQMLQEFIDSDPTIDFLNDMVMVHYGIYKLVFKTSINPETGNTEIDDVAFKKVEENK